MPHIKHLAAHEAQKIAAGQVVERPASIVKELIENSLDAGATQISVYITQGGKECIRIIDNGVGMDEVDAQRCFDNHATSKISTIDELQTINTYGFRGEALASIAAVCHTTLITKTIDAYTGTQVIVDQGTILSAQPIASNTGTDITIKNLFAHVPARRKFLKADQTETRHIMQLIHAFCLYHLSVQFIVYVDDEHMFTCPPTDSRDQRCSIVWQQETNNHFFNISATRTNPRVTIAGTISNHQKWRYDRSGITIFVNGRWVRNQKLATALLKGYGSVLPTGRFPFACIIINVDAHEVDINTHPRKEEVQFNHPRVVEQLLQAAVHERLSQGVSATFHATPRATSPVIAPVSFSTYTPSTIIDSGFLHTINASSSPTGTLIEPDTVTAQLSVHDALVTSTDEQTIAELHDTFQIIGNYHKTYIIVESSTGLVLVDQHAAHERILYERFGTRFEQSMSVPLLFPLHVTLARTDVPVIEAQLPLLADHGIVASLFAGDRLIIESVPTFLKHIDFTDFIHYVITMMRDSSGEDAALMHQVTHALRAQMACKAAVKAGDKLSLQLMYQLVRDLYQSPNRLTCPHGRPTQWTLSLDDIERKFKRRQ